MPHAWIRNYQLFLFDFDGLLVNTEALHFAAYVEMCKRRGFVLNWSLTRYFQEAHFDASGLKNAIYKEFPDLFTKEPRWEVLYAEKKKIYMEFLKQGKLALMPGVAAFLKELARKEAKMCVVTNSSKEQVESIKAHLPELGVIPHWITREYYSNPKPDPECYQKALAEFACPHERAIGFEDSWRGYQALIGSGAKGVLIAPSSHPQMAFIPKNTLHFSSFDEMPTHEL